MILGKQAIKFSVERDLLLNVLNFHNPQVTSISLSMTKGMMGNLKKIAEYRGCSERQLACELLQCAIADEVAKMSKLNVLKNLKVGGKD